MTDDNGVADGALGPALAFGACFLALAALLIAAYCCGEETPRVQLATDGFDEFGVPLTSPSAPR